MFRSRTKSSDTRKRRRSANLRTWRQKIDLDGAIVSGPPALGEVVYGYSFPSRPDRIKIGYSSRGLARVAEQSTSFPEKPKLIFVIHHSSARKMEEAFHVALADKQADVMGTEWFDVSIRDLLAVSPILRRATGASRRRRNLQLGACLVLAGLGALLVPATLGCLAALSDGVGLSRTLSAAAAYMEALLTGNFSQAKALGEGLWSYGSSRVHAAGWIRIGWAPVIVLGILPWIPWRRQAM